MKTKREATEMKKRLEERNPGSKYEVAKDQGPNNAHSPWYVHRTLRGEKKA